MLETQFATWISEEVGSYSMSIFGMISWGVGWLRHFKKWMILHSRDALNSSKVAVKNFLFIKESWNKFVFNIDNNKKSVK